MGEERRRSPRYPFVATAELIEADTRTKMETRVTELSLNGCYFDMVNPLPDGTPLHVKIFCENDFFEARGVVVYSQPHLGMGATFNEISPHFLPILKKWLLKAMLSAKPGGI